MDGLLHFPFNIYRPFIKNLDSFPVDLVVGLRLVFSGCRCYLFLMFIQSLLQSSRCFANVMLSVIREHQSLANHEIDWKGVKILNKESVDVQRKIKEAIHIYQTSTPKAGAMIYPPILTICRHVIKQFVSSRGNVSSL